MSAEETIINGFKAVARQIDMSDSLEMAYLSIESEYFTDYNKLHEKICQFNALTGWFTLQSKNMLLDEWRRQSKDDFGFILCGELADDKSSIHIRQSREGWTWTEMKDEVVGNEILFVETLKLASVEGKQYLSYRVYWKKIDDLGYRATYARFTGMTQGV